MKIRPAHRLILPLLALSLALLACAPQLTIFETPGAGSTSIVPTGQAVTQPASNIDATEPTTDQETTQPTTVAPTRNASNSPATVPTVDGPVSLHHAAMRAGFEGD